MVLLFVIWLFVGNSVVLYVAITIETLYSLFCDFIVFSCCFVALFVVW